MRYSSLRLLGAALMLGACNDGGPRNGGLNVRIAASGNDIDADGFTVVVNGTRELAIAPGENEVRVTGLADGRHDVELRDVASYCIVAANPRAVEVRSGRLADVLFNVDCTVTGVEVQLVAAGVDHDRGYAVRIDGAHAATIPPGGRARIGRLAPGEHALTVSEVPANCRVESPQPILFTIQRGEVEPFDILVLCRATSGVVQVDVVTTGQDQDLSGYEVTSSGAPTTRRTLRLSGTAFLDGIPPGTQQVRINRIAPNCTAEGDSVRTVQVTAGTEVRDTVRVAFAIACTRAWNLAFTHVTRGVWADAFEILVATSDFRQVDVIAIGADPSWSPDGKRVAYHDTGRCDPYYYYYYETCTDVGLAVIDIDGTEARRLTDGFDREPAWSPDGSKILFVRPTPQTPGELTVINAGGGTPTRIVTPGLEAANPSWSPDGGSIAFECGGQSSNICIVKADGTGLKQLQSPFTEKAPDWSPDGKRIVFVRHGIEGPRLATMASDGKDVSVFESTVDVADPDWLPDGRIVFVEQTCSSNRCVGKGISLINSDWSGKTTLTTSSTAHAPAWRP